MVCATEGRPHRFAFFSADLHSTIHTRELANVHSRGQDLADLLELYEDRADAARWLDALDVNVAELAMLSRVGVILRSQCHLYSIQSLKRDRKSVV